MNRWLCAVLSVGLLFSLFSVPGAVPSAAQAYQAMPGGPPIVLRLDPTPSTHRVPAPVRALSPESAQSANISIVYLPAGATSAFGHACLAWPAAAQTAFDFAAGIWETLVTSPVTIVIEACWADLAAGILGSSGADDYYRNFGGAPVTNTWYPVALANALYGSDLDPTSPDMHIVYNKDYQDSGEWYFGTGGTPSGSQIDFVSVVLHEIAHGLGFSGSMRVSSGLGSWGSGAPYPFSYDRYTEDGGGTALINTATYPNPSIALGNALTNSNVWFDGPHANAANGGGRVKLYAPSPWVSGSSYSHLDEVFNGTQNALMTWSLNSGESIHTPGPVAMGILQDAGWAVGADPPPTMSSITPNVGDNSGSVAFSIVGSDFLAGASAKLTRTGQPDIDATGLVVSASQMTGTLNLLGAATGPWNVVVTNPDLQIATLVDGFTITSAGKTWTGALSADWHTSGNWTPVGVPGSGDDVFIPAVAFSPVISAGSAAAKSLTIQSGATLDFADRELTVEGVLTNNGTLKQTRAVTQATSTEFLRITNLAGTLTQYWGVAITPSSTGNVSATVAISGNQFCADRSAGVKRCYDIDPTAPISGTVRFYFSEVERNVVPLNDLRVFRYGGSWIEEPGPYSRGGSSDAQYVEAQNVAGFALFALDGPGLNMVYLPLALKGYPPLVETRSYAVEDATIIQNAPSYNSGDTVDMWAGYVDRFCWNPALAADPAISRSLVRFNLSSVPVGATIRSARLYLLLVDWCRGPNTSPRTVTIYRASSAWSESAVNWNAQPGLAEAYGSAAVGFPSADTWYSFDVTGLVQGWVNSSLPNYGITIRGPEEPGIDSVYFAFATSESTYDPYVLITYTGVASSEEQVVIAPLVHDPGVGSLSDQFAKSPNDAGSGVSLQTKWSKLP